MRPLGVRIELDVAGTKALHEYLERVRHPSAQQRCRFPPTEASLRYYTEIHRSPPEQRGAREYGAVPWSLRLREIAAHRHGQVVALPRTAHLASCCPRPARPRRGGAPRRTGDRGRTRRRPRNAPSRRNLACWLATSAVPLQGSSQVLGADGRREFLQTLRLRREATVFTAGPRFLKALWGCTTEERPQFG